MPVSPAPSGSRELSPEIVQKIADRVYALLLAEAKREMERSRRKTGMKRKR